MRGRVLLATVLLLAAAASLVRAVVTRDGVGPIEYVASALIIAGLVATALVAVRRDRRV
jgi:hypothetical protein